MLPPASCAAPRLRYRDLGAGTLGLSRYRGRWVDLVLKTGDLLRRRVEAAGMGRGLLILEDSDGRLQAMPRRLVLWWAPVVPAEATDASVLQLCEHVRAAGGVQGRSEASNG